MTTWSKSGGVVWVGRDGFDFSDTLAHRSTPERALAAAEAFFLSRGATCAERPDPLTVRLVRGSERFSRLSWLLSGRETSFRHTITIAAVGDPDGTKLTVKCDVFCRYTILAGRNLFAVETAHLREALVAAEPT